MKLNPFSKKINNGYFAHVKTQHEQLGRERTALRAELSLAEADYAQVNDKYDRLCKSAGSMSMNPLPAASAMRPQVNAAYQRVAQLKSKISSLEDRMAPLHRVLVAPDDFAQSKARLAELVAQRKSLDSDREVAEARAAKLQKRITDLEARIATETKAASQHLLEAEGEFVVPEQLARLETELRIVRASLAEQQARKEAIAAQLGEMPKAMRKARDSYVANRAVVAEIELYEQLMPIMESMARASVTQREISGRRDECRYEIEIPQELVEAADAALTAEVPAA